MQNPDARPHSHRSFVRSCLQTSPVMLSVHISTSPGLSISLAPAVVLAPIVLLSLALCQTLSQDLQTPGIVSSFSCSTFPVIIIIVAEVSLYMKLGLLDGGGPGGCPGSAGSSKKGRVLKNSATRTGRSHKSSSRRSVGC